MAEKDGKSKISAKFNAIGKLFKSCQNGSKRKQYTANAENSGNVQQIEELRRLNILILGNSGSGKSTMINQMRKTYNGGIDEKSEQM